MDSLRRTDPEAWVDARIAAAVAAAPPLPADVRLSIRNLIVAAQARDTTRKPGETVESDG